MQHLKSLNLIKKVNTKPLFYLLLLFISFGVTACDQNNNKKDDGDDNTLKTYLYYVDKNETKVVSEEYKPQGTTKEELITEYFEALSQEPKDISYKTVKPANLIMEKFVLNEGKLLSIYFNSDYNNLTGITEVLCRATIVKTLSQIEGVDYIEFYVGGQPLMRSNEKPVGLMEADDFIVATETEDVFATVYFSNEEGTALLASNLKITYDGSIPIEKLVLERLIAGPIEKNMILTLPKGTEIIKTTTKDGICYVDFNEKFLEKVPKIEDEVVLYSVVNSLIELSNINKVQFTINGETKKVYGDDIPFDTFFERKLELVEGSK